MMSDNYLYNADRVEIELKCLVPFCNFTRLFDLFCYFTCI